MSDPFKPRKYLKESVQVGVWPFEKYADVIDLKHIIDAKATFLALEGTSDGKSLLVAYKTKRVLNPAYEADMALYKKQNKGKK